MTITIDHPSEPEEDPRTGTRVLAPLQRYALAKVLAARRREIGMPLGQLLSRGSRFGIPERELRRLMGLDSTTEVTWHRLARIFMVDPDGLWAAVGAEADRTFKGDHQVTAPEPWELYTREQETDAVT